MEGNEWRLIRPLRDAALVVDPVQRVRDAIVATYEQDLGISPPGVATARADLLVTGRRAFSDFAAAMPSEGGPGRGRRTGRARHARTTRGHAAVGATRHHHSVGHRAYRVAWFLRGAADRGGLRWIGVTSEDDLPHRPVNVPCTRYPQHDLTVTVPGDLGDVVVQTRFAIATAADRRHPGPRGEPTSDRGDSGPAAARQGHPVHSGFGFAAGGGGLDHPVAPAPAQRAAERIRGDRHGSSRGRLRGTRCHHGGRCMATGRAAGLRPAVRRARPGVVRDAAIPGGVHRPVRRRTECPARTTGPGRVAPCRGDRGQPRRQSRAAVGPARRLDQECRRLVAWIGVARRAARAERADAGCRTSSAWQLSRRA